MSELADLGIEAPDDPADWCTVAEASTRLGITRDEVLDMVRRRRLRAMRDGAGTLLVEPAVVYP